MRHDESGAFTSGFAARKTWKVDGRLLAAMVHVLPDKCSVVDIGAGVGLYVEALRAVGHESWGIDGISGVEALSNGLVRCINLACELSTVRVAAWGLCIEVGEHIPADKEGVFLDNVARHCLDGLIVSWATPGQRGTGHVNCREPEHVRAMFAGRGFVVDSRATRDAGAIAGEAWAKKLLVLRRDHSADPYWSEQV